MGLQGVDPADRMEWLASNPEHWESLAAAQFDDALLASMGGSWDAPPEPGRTPDPAAAGLGGGHRTPADIMAAAYPAPGPLVWKDPRACLLLPYWRRVLPGPLTAVFVWRDPLAVARSLHARDGMSVEYGLALWERYNRSAAAGLQGVDTFVLDYRAAVEDPWVALGAVAEWLRSLDRFGPSSDGWDIDAGAATVDRNLRHQAGGTDDDAPGVPADARIVAEWLETLGGGHRPFAAGPPAPASPWPDALIALGREQLELSALKAELRQARHRAEAMERELRSGYQAEIDRLVDDLNESRERCEELAYEVRRVTSSASWKVTRPLRSAATRLPRPTR
jgi:hypothetical protein